MFRIRSILESKITWALILLFIFYIAFIFSEKYANILALKVYINNLNEEIEELEQTNNSLSEKVELLNTAPYIEQIAREELDLVKPNEILYKTTKNK